MTSSIPTSLRLPRGRDYDPFAHAEALGVQVIFRSIRTANELWMPEFNTIVIRNGLRSVHQRIAVAHGIQHAALGHQDDRPRHEFQANRMAALYLIHPDELRSVSHWAGDDLELIAAELGVSTTMLEALRAS